MNINIRIRIWTVLMLVALPAFSAAQDTNFELKMLPPAEAITLGEGVAYLILSEGDGALPMGERLNHFLRVNQDGWSADGERLYNSEQDGISTYRISQLERALPALASAFKAVPLGSSFRLWLPASAIPENSRTLNPVDQVVDFQMVDFLLPLPPPPDVGAIPDDARLTSSGVGIKTLHPGDGKTHPTLEDTLTVHYSGWTSDGQLFDSTHLRDRTASFPLGVLIQGWQDALPLMTLGEKARIWLPGALAYDNREDRPYAPKGMLIFDVEILAIEPPEPETEISKILTLKEQNEIRDGWLMDRFETVLPALMRREAIDMWILIAREYNEDPVVKTMLPAGWLSARRRTVLIFFDPGEGQPVERLSVSRYDTKGLYEPAWDKEQQPDQWQRIADIIAERDPEKIALNISPVFALADGLTKSQYDGLTRALGSDYSGRIVPGDGLAIGWLETRTEQELALYPHIVALAHEIIAEGFSDQVITPGKTTASELQWWFRERIRALGLETWFHPSINIQRAEKLDQGFVAAFTETDAGGVIVPGDLLHVDFGIKYLGLNTDTQEHAYVLKPGETQAPEGLQRALADGNRLQDILLGAFKTGRTGNEILLAALEKAKSQGLTPAIYTHPLGYHGHGAGPTIGLWDQQWGVTGRGDYPLYPMTAYSIELNVSVAIPEWNDQVIRIMLEEDAWFDGEKVVYLDGRQTELFLIPSDE